MTLRDQFIVRRLYDQMIKVLYMIVVLNGDKGPGSDLKKKSFQLASCYKLLQVVASCYKLLHVWYKLLQVVIVLTSCCKLLHVVANRYKLLQIFTSCCKSLQVVVNRYKLFQIVTCCCNLLQVVTSCCKRLQVVASGYKLLCYKVLQELSSPIQHLTSTHRNDIG